MNLRKYLYFLIFPVLAAIIALSVRTVAVSADEGTDGAYSGTTYFLIQEYRL